jgi:trimeric autotransporter adhesin
LSYTNLEYLNMFLNLWVMEKRLFYFVIAIALIFVFKNVQAQTPAPGTATFKYQTGLQTTSTSAYADFVPGSGLGQDGGYGYEFITQGSGTTFTRYTQVSYYVFNLGTNDGMISFDRNSANVTIQAAFIRSARTGAATTQSLTTKPVAGGPFKMNSIALLALSGTPTISVQAYNDGVAVGLPQTAAINSTTKTTIDFSTNPNFYSIDEIGITGFNADGIRADNLMSTTAVVNTGVPAFTYASPQVYTSGTVITSLGPTSTGGAVGAYGPFSTFANVNTPGGIHVDASGNIYVSDTNDNSVYEFNSAGAAMPGSPHTGAGLQSPYGVSVDALGNIYTANGPSGTVTKITAGGVVSNIAGFNFPVDLGTDASNNLYVSDLGDFSVAGGSIRKVLAGASTASVLLTGLNNPSGIAINSLGDIFIAQYPANNIIKVASGTTTQTIFVSTGLNSPYGLEFGPLGNLYVADNGSNTIKRITPAGILTTINGTGLSFPYDVGFDPSGNMYTTDNGSNTAQKSVGSGYVISPALPGGLNFNNYSGAISGTPTTAMAATIYTVTATNAIGSSTATISISVNPAAPTITYASPQVYAVGVAIPPLRPANTGGAVGSYGAATTFANVNTPYSVVVDATNNIFTTDDADGDLYKYNSAGAGGTIYTSLNQPTGILDDASGNIYVSNWGNNTVCKFSPSGTLLATIPGFNGPYGITADNLNNIYVVDNGTGSIIKIAAGTTTTSTFLTGFTNPYGITIDASGNTFVSDMTANSIIEVASGSTTHTTFATGFSGPRNIQPDDFGNIYVADFVNNVIKSVTPGGVVTTILSGLSSPRDVDFDASGNLYVANSGTNSIKKSVATGYSVTSGTLPSGLYLNAYTGFISGTPTTVTSATNVTVTATNVTGSSSAVINITVGKLVIWTAGNSSTAWTDGANWSTNSVPGISDAVSIGISAYTHPFEPSITANTSVNSITFGAAHAAVLTVGAGKTLTVGNNLTVNTGAVATLAGTVTGAVNIAPAAFVNITGTGVLTINSPLSFTLMSDATGSASIGQILSTSITGTGANSINVQRYLTGGSLPYRGYRLLSSPVYASTAGGNKVYSINYLKNSILVTGTSTSGGFDNTAAANPTLYLYRENMTPLYSTFLNSNFKGINNINSSPAYSMDDASNPTINIPVGNGYLCFFRGNRASSNYTAETVAAYIPQTVTLSTSGTLNQGQITVKDWFTPASLNLSYTAASPAAIQGYNLVGNPYASSIDWETYQTATPNTGIYGAFVGASIYVLDPISHNYGVYVKGGGGVGTNNSSNVIVSGQGFFVVASSTSAQLIFNESAKIAAQVTSPKLLMGKPVDYTSNQYLRLQLAKDTINTDDILIRFNHDACTAYDPSEDARYLPGFGVVSLSSLSSDHVQLAISVQPLPKTAETLGLTVNVKADGNYSLNMKNMAGIPQLFDVWLMDAYKKDLLDMRHNTTYSFDVLKSDTNTFGSGRFALVIRQNPAYAYRLLNFTAAKAAALTSNPRQVQTVWVTENEQNYTNFTVERSTDGGKTFDELGGFLSSGALTYGFLDKTPLSGLNQYRLKQEDLNGTVSYSNVIPVMYSTLSNKITNNNINVYPNPAGSTISLSIVQNLVTASNTTAAYYNISIMNSSGLIVKTFSSVQALSQSNVSNLLPGTYIIKVANSSNKSMVGQSKFVKL